jgi:hypothetical protein
VRRKVLRTLVITAVLGLGSNVLVTAWCVWRIAIPPLSRGYAAYLAHGPHQFITLFEHTPGKAISWREPARDFVASSAIAEVAPDPPRWVDLDLDLESTAATANRRFFDHPARRYEIAYGWPMLSFRGGLLATPWRTPPATHDYPPALPEIPAMLAIGLSAEPRAMPLMPIFPGVVLNTALYGAAWWAVLFSPGVIRRERRRRRGACLACGYDRRGIAAGAVCPECGAKSQERERLATATTVFPMG